jgi:prepilin-type N-terminal cleavage/methylation domain-containing protein
MRKTAFSLVELLVVIAIIAILTSFTVTGFKNIATSHGVGQAAADVNGILELARNEAVTRQTYVWAAFREATNSGVLEIQMALAGSIDGTPNAAGTNLMALSRVVRARNVGLTNWGDLKPETQALLTNAPAPVDLGSTAGITYTNLPLAKFPSTSITFTPRGEAMLKGSPATADGFTPLIAIGIVPSRGDTKDPSTKENRKEDTAVVVDGSTGMSRVLRR